MFVLLDIDMFCYGSYFCMRDTRRAVTFTIRTAICIIKILININYTKKGKSLASIATGSSGRETANENFQDLTGIVLTHCV